MVNRKLLLLRSLILQTLMSSIGLNIRIPKDSIIKLHELENKTLVVKFSGGREVQGDLKSWDKSMNLILNNTQEVIGLE